MTAIADAAAWIAAVIAEIKATTRNPASRIPRKPI